MSRQLGMVSCHKQAVGVATMLGRAHDRPSTRASTHDKILPRQRIPVATDLDGVT